MKIKRFHQLVKLEQGKVNTTVLDLLKGNVFQVENPFIDKFQNRDYQDIPDFLQSLEDEELLIETDEDEWVPGISTAKTEYDSDLQVPLVLEIEQGADISLINRALRGYNVSRVLFYGTRLPEPGAILPQAGLTDIVLKKKNIEECYVLSRVNEDFLMVEESYFRFNHHYNSCWGQKIAVTADHAIRPCIHSGLTAGNLETDDMTGIFTRLKEYWGITKDKVEKCKDCELRHICFDCREIARKAGGNLHATNPNCHYDPYSGAWSR
jgi:radical SAM protein with 4Fe4S-binding SPASM domain